MKKTRKAGDRLKEAFKKMEKPASKGGTGGTFKAAATKAGYPDSTEGRDDFAQKVLNNKDDYSPKMVKKANFYKNIISK
tara:strand:- start:369 stop:605 length:237 start_codon:yes stop_codon:yes gene_type:complete